MMSMLRPGTTVLTNLRDDLRGEVVLPDDAGYDAARAVYNTMHEFWPALIVRAADAGDVARTVRFARDEGLILAVRGGNHSMCGHGSCNDGVVLDLSMLRSVDVDPAAREARVGGGATWGDVNAATHRHGLATTGGLISTTGVGGLTLGGGVGYLTRRLGLACDNLIAVELVTARGRIIHVDQRERPDLFRALRGGGGNFGVVTCFTFRLAPIRTVLGGPIVFSLEHDVVHRFDELMCNAPRELGAILGLTLAPPLPFLPQERHGTPAAVIIACWSGEEAEGREVLGELAQIGTAWGQAITPMPYPAINTLFDGLLPAGLRHYWKSQFITLLRDEAIAAYIEHARATPTIESGIFLYPVDGAAHDVEPSETAWAHRGSRWLVGFHGSWHDVAQDAPIRDWVRRSHAAGAPWADRGAYVNFRSDDGAEPVGWGEVEADLVATKKAHDPNNFFCLNPNIDPEAGT